tara:strand:- start:37196 stop:38992 length:1797 start_codon:yes stop_codon:yes gene_type:complete
MAKKIKSIDYTSRDFESIRQDLINYTKKYYPDSFKDFNEAGFGALMLDSVAYVGDMLSFYLDYQANESFLETSMEYANIVKHGRQMGYKYPGVPSSSGLVSLYITVPANADGTGPDMSYVPTLLKGTQFTSLNGSIYTLMEDVYFGNATNEVVVSTVDSSTGVPTNFAIKTSGLAISGRLISQEETVGDFQKFLRIGLNNPNATEIVSCVDSEGHEYFEVDHLSQNVIYKAIRNNNQHRKSTPSILKAVPVPRRFVLERSPGVAFLQFGYGSDNELVNSSVVDPANIVMNIHGRDYSVDEAFDPTKLTATDKFGIVPSNTTLNIVFRANASTDVNASVGTINGVSLPLFKFTNQGALNAGLRTTVRGSLEVLNEEPFVGDVAVPSGTELKQRMYSFYATQNRAVTAEDYKSMVYAMPGRFGAVKKCSVSRDFDSFKRNLNLYVVSVDSNNKLSLANTTIKNNIKTWLNRYKMINDTVDILDAKIVNFGIKFIVVADYEENKYDVLNRATAALKEHFLTNSFDIGEPIYITDIYKALQKVKGVVDVVDVIVVQKRGGVYSNTTYDFEAAISNDGRKILAEEDLVFELKYRNTDIVGSVS